MGPKSATRLRPQEESVVQSRRGGFRRGAFYVAMMLIILTLLVGAMVGYARIKLRANAQDIEALSDRPPGQPMNVLVLGSDSRAVLPEEDQARFDPTGRDRTSGQRADTIALIHVDEKRRAAILVHFPRDLKITYPNGTTGRINGAYQKGPDAVVNTVESFTGLPIHHYIEVNFVGFRNIVNALDGVNVYFERPITEPDSGLDVRKGCVKLKGDQALAFVRVRKIDDDFGRIARQQLFLRLLMQKVVSAETLLNPVRGLRLLNLIGDNVTTDADLDLWDMKTLAWRLRSFDPSRVDMRVVPSNPRRLGGVSYVVANERQTKELFTAIRERASLPDFGRIGVSPIDPREIRVSVLNGTGQGRLAAQEGQVLRAKGYQVVETVNTGRSGYRETIVFFRQGSEEQARFVAAQYGAETKPVPSTIRAAGEVVIVLGSDYAQGRATPEPAPSPTANSQPADEPLIHSC